MRCALERHPRIAALCVGLIALGLTDLGCGLLYKVVTGESLYYAVVDPERGVNRAYRTSSPIYHHDLRPNMRAPASWGADYTIATNSLGFKDREVRQVALRASGPRILFMGDSFTEGVSFPYEATFVGLLDDHFRAQGIEVLNAGVSSYSAAIYYRKLRYLLDEVGLQVSHVVVFLDISDVEDEAEYYQFDDQDNVVFRKRESTAVRELFREYSVLYALPRYLKLRLGDAQSARRKLLNPLNASIDDERAQWTISEEWFARYGERGVRATRGSLDRLAALLATHHVPLTLVVYPWPTQIIKKDLDSLQVRIWREWAQQRGAGFINLFPAFVSQDDAVNQQTIRDLFIAHDFHWNAAGHERVAKAFLEQFSIEGARGNGAAQPAVPRSSPRIGLEGVSQLDSLMYVSAVRLAPSDPPVVPPW